MRVIDGGFVQRKSWPSVGQWHEAERRVDAGPVPVLFGLRAVKVERRRRSEMGSTLPFDLVPRTAGIGATPSLPRDPAKVSSPSHLRTLARQGLQLLAAVDVAPPAADERGRPGFHRAIADTYLPPGEPHV